MIFFALRYFEVQSSFTLFAPPISPKDLFITPFLERKEIEYYNKLYTTRLLQNNNDERYLIGYLLKSTDTHLIELNQRLFREEDIQNWEKLFFILDRERQLIIVQYQTEIATPENVKNVLQKLGSPILEVSLSELLKDIDK